MFIKTVIVIACIAVLFWAFGARGVPSRRADSRGRGLDSDRGRRIGQVVALLVVAGALAFAFLS
jgi:hypothetical protein